MTTVRVSLCMIVKDEAAWLPRCLKSVRGFVEELIVADTGSRDATAAIARTYGARVLAVSWREDFAAARNAALACATGDWVLQLDADETLPETSGACLRRQVEASTSEGVRARVRSVGSRRELAAYEEERVVRLFRNRTAYRYAGRVCEQIQPAIERRGGRVEDAEVTILHHGYAEDDRGGPNRRLRTLALYERALTDAPADGALCYRIGAAYHALGDRARASRFLLRALKGRHGREDEWAPRAYRRLAQLALAQDEFETARRYARACLECQPGELVALYVLGLADFLQGRPDRACNQFERIQALPNLNPARSAELAAVLGHCRRLLGDAPARI
jgi:glycosyltransferase involved in cell wall biosynthesis